MKNQTILMCRPTYFDVNYSINPWMESALYKVDKLQAGRQWSALYEYIKLRADVAIMDSQSGLPDLVFTANAGLVYGNKAIVSRFTNYERQGEEAYYKAFFEQAGYEIVKWPRYIPFEGAGDALFSHDNRFLWVGYGFRSHPRASGILSNLLIDFCPVSALKLIDPRFYHLDTCFTPLAGEVLMYYPGAFDEDSNKLIKRCFSKIIKVSEEDALNFACNAVVLDEYVIMNSASESLQESLMKCHYTPIIVPMTEFLKSGGSAKCLTLKLVEP